MKELKERSDEIWRDSSETEENVTKIEPRRFDSTLPDL